MSDEARGGSSEQEEAVKKMIQSKIKDAEECCERVER